MNATEWKPIAAKMVRRYPHVDWAAAATSGTLEQVLEDLADLQAEHVAAAADVLYREGREFPPTGGQIRKKVYELAVDVPPWPDVWDQLHCAARRFGHYDVAAAIEAITAWHPLAGHFARQLPFRTFCLTTEPEVVHGQARRQWEALVRQVERDGGLEGLEADGLRAIERANGQPRQLGSVLRDLKLIEGEEAAA